MKTCNFADRYADALGENSSSDVPKIDAFQNTENTSTFGASIDVTTL